MATGDAAALAGMDLVSGSTPRNTIDTEINKTRDYIAERESVVDGDTTAAAARNTLDVYDKDHTVSTNGSADIQLRMNGTLIEFYVNGVKAFHLP